MLGITKAKGLASQGINGPEDPTDTDNAGASSCRQLLKHGCSGCNPSDAGLCKANTNRQSWQTRENVYQTLVRYVILIIKYLINLKFNMAINLL